MDLPTKAAEKLWSVLESFGYEEPELVYTQDGEAEIEYEDGSTRLFFGLSRVVISGLLTPHLGVGAGWIRHPETKRWNCSGHAVALVNTNEDLNRTVEFESLADLQRWLENADSTEELEEEARAWARA